MIVNGFISCLEGKYSVFVTYENKLGLGKSPKLGHVWAVDIDEGTVQNIRSGHYIDFTTNVLRLVIIQPVTPLVITLDEGDNSMVITKVFLENDNMTLDFSNVKNPKLVACKYDGKSTTQTWKFASSDGPHEKIPYEFIAGEWYIKTESSCLQNNNSGVQVAFVSSDFIFNDLLDTTEQVKKTKSLEFCGKLSQKFGIETFSCHDRHRAFVFYTIRSVKNSEKWKQWCTPRRLARRIHTNPELISFFKKWKLESWAKQYPNEFTVNDIVDSLRVMHRNRSKTRKVKKKIFDIDVLVDLISSQSLKDSDGALLSDYIRSSEYDPENGKLKNVVFLESTIKAAMDPQYKTKKEGFTLLYALCSWRPSLATHMLSTILDRDKDFDINKILNNNGETPQHGYSKGLKNGNIKYDPYLIYILWIAHADFVAELFDNFQFSINNSFLECRGAIEEFMMSRTIQLYDDLSYTFKIVNRSGETVWDNSKNKIDRPNPFTNILSREEVSQILFYSEWADISEIGYKEIKEDMIEEDLKEMSVYLEEN